MGIVMIQLRCGVSNRSTRGIYEAKNSREQQESNSTPVDSLEGTIAQTNADSGSSDTHTSRHGQLVLREDENGDCCAKFHGRAAGRRVVGNFVTHNYK
jgi:hypothetical protein